MLRKSRSRDQNLEACRKTSGELRSSCHTVRNSNVVLEMWLSSYGCYYLYGCERENRKTAIHSIVQPETPIRDGLSTANCGVGL